VSDLEQGGAAGPSSQPGPDRRKVLTTGAVGIVSLALPAAAAAATGGGVAPSSVGTLTFSEVSETGFTVSWA